MTTLARASAALLAAAVVLLTFAASVWLFVPDDATDDFPDAQLDVWGD